MRLLVYEWCCSGGLHGPDALAVVGDDSADGLLAEGRLMLEAVARDAAGFAGYQTTLLIDGELSASARPQPPPGVACQEVTGGGELAALLAAAAIANAIILVAPETAGVLASRLALLDQAGLGDRVIGGPAAFATAAADKQTTCQLLAAAGLPVPAGCCLAVGDPLPQGFRLPAILKARGSAGGDGLRRLSRTSDFRVPAEPARLECLAEGTPASVCCLCGPRGILPLLPMEQLFSTGGPPAFTGIRPLAAACCGRATALAVRAIGALARATGSLPRGWVGVDMIMGHREDGRADRLLEVNPRLTTSFVGLTRGQPGGLMQPLLDQAVGRPTELSPWNHAACQLLLP